MSEFNDKRTEVDRIIDESNIIIAKCQDLISQAKTLDADADKLIKESNLINAKSKELLRQAKALQPKARTNLNKAKRLADEMEAEDTLTICNICQHQWSASYQTYIDVLEANDALECPECGNMTGYPKDDTKEDWQE